MKILIEFCKMKYHNKLYLPYVKEFHQLGISLCVNTYLFSNLGLLQWRYSRHYYQDLQTFVGYQGRFLVMGYQLLWSLLDSHRSPMHSSTWKQIDLNLIFLMIMIPDRTLRFHHSYHRIWSPLKHGQLSQGGAFVDLWVIKAYCMCPYHRW